MHKRISLKELVPPNAVAVTIKYKVNLPNDVYVSSTGDRPGTALKPPCGLIEIMLVEPQTIYVLALHASTIDISVEGYRVE